MAEIKDIAKGAGVGSGSLLTGFVALWFSYIEPKLDDLEHKIETQVEQHLINKLGDHSDATLVLLQRELSKLGKNVAIEDIAGEIASGVIWRDSLQVFDQGLKPMLLDELKTFDVGLKVDKLTNQIKYLHTDGNVYYPAYNDEYQMFYFMNQQGATEWCH